jgi:predicted ArsR family transcriptional regulator
MSTGTDSVSPTQRRVLEKLKRRGDATADQLAEDLGTTTSAARQHLSALRSAGFVTSTPERGRTGRPSDRYRATPASEQVFAAGAELTVQILELVDDEDPEMVDRLFAGQRRRLVEQSAEALEGKSVGERVAAVTELLDAAGYLADFESTDDGRYRIHLRSCPIWSVADRYRQACAAELGVVQDLIPNATVTRTTHKTAGTHTCTYEINPHS